MSARIEREWEVFTAKMDKFVADGVLSQELVTRYVDLLDGMPVATSQTRILTFIRTLMKALNILQMVDPKLEEDLLKWSVAIRAEMPTAYLLHYGVIHEVFATPKNKRARDTKEELLEDQAKYWAEQQVSLDRIKNAALNPVFEERYVFVVSERSFAVPPAKVLLLKVGDEYALENERYSQPKDDEVEIEGIAFPDKVSALKAASHVLRETLGHRLPEQTRSTVERVLEKVDAEISSATAN